MEFLTLSQQFITDDGLLHLIPLQQMKTLVITQVGTGLTCTPLTPPPPVVC
jgi:hypothetical protein